jgi:REP element-mobilizing transposase RayT
MTKARCVLKGKTYLFTRSTVAQLMLLRPDPDVTHLLLYLLAVNCDLFKMQFHAVCAMSNHIHLILTDTGARFPEFFQAFNAEVTMALQRIRGFEGPLWDHRRLSAVSLETPQAVVEKIAYVLANPVRADLVEHAHEWPGAKVVVDELGRGEIRVERPKFYFDPNNSKWPEVATLAIELPPTVDANGADGFRHAVAAEIKHVEDAARERRREQQQVVLGAEEAKTISPQAQPAKKRPRGQRSPTFAVGRGQSEARKAAILAHREFLIHYRRALEQWKAGNHEAVFPEGTWKMRVLYRARTAGQVAAAA